MTMLYGTYAGVAVDMESNFTLSLELRVCSSSSGANVPAPCKSCLSPSWLCLVHAPVGEKRLLQATCFTIRTGVETAYLGVRRSRGELPKSKNSVTAAE